MAVIFVQWQAVIFDRLYDFILTTLFLLIYILYGIIAVHCLSQKDLLYVLGDSRIVKLDVFCNIALQYLAACDDVSLFN